MNMTSQHKGYLAYQQAHANELEQATLILMMFSGGIDFINKALKLWGKDKTVMSEYISKAKNVLLELISSLNIEESGEIGQFLFSAYKGLFIKLTAAHIQDDIQKITEVRDSLIELEETWKEVFKSEEYRMFKKNKDYVKTVNYAQR